MNNEISVLRESIATLETQLSEAEGRAIILQAQLGSSEAACAAQILAVRQYLKAVRYIGLNAPQLAAREQLEHAIDTNAGELLLSRLKPADELADAVEQEQELRQAAEIDPARRMELAAASYRLGIALANYRQTQKARGQ